MNSIATTSCDIQLPKVSVLISTYNQEKYITQAVESVLAQQTTFEFEIVIADDCSRDCTTAIVQRFEKEHPGRIRVNRTERNLGMCINFACAFLMCRGRYVALLEGDDYWTAPYKLQRQADYLDAHPGCSLAFHPVHVVGGNNIGPVIPKSAPPLVSVEDLLWNNLIPTCSIMFRRSALTELPIWCATMKMLDWPLCIFLMQSGPAGFLDETMGAYRVHGDGIWTSLSRKHQLESIIEVLKRLNDHFMDRYSSTIRRSLAHSYAGLAWHCESQGQVSEAVRAAWRAMVTRRFCDFQCALNFLRLLLRLKTPRLHRLVKRIARRPGLQPLPVASHD